MNDVMMSQSNFGVGWFCWILLWHGTTATTAVDHMGDWQKPNHQGDWLWIKCGYDDARQCTTMIKLLTERDVHVIDAPACHFTFFSLSAPFINTQLF